METVATRVLSAAKSAYPDTLTNRQLANRTGIPEPSVRRTTRQLTRNGQLMEWSGGHSNTPVAYRAANV